MFSAISRWRGGTGGGEGDGETEERQFITFRRLTGCGRHAIIARATCDKIG